jgi:hypothetical protein
MKDPKPCPYCDLPTYGEWHSCCKAQAARIRALEAALRQIAELDRVDSAHIARSALETK